MSGQNPASRSYRDLLLVLRTFPLGESDRIVVGLSPVQGVVRGVAKGVRKSTSRLGARLEPFMISDVGMARGRNLETIAQATTRKAYSAPIVADWDAYTVASAACEVAEHVGLGEQDRAGELFTLTAGALSAMARGLHPPHQVLDSFLIRVLGVAGWHLETQRCVRCGAPTTEDGWWSVADGGTVGAECRAPGDRPLAPGELSYLQSVATGNWAALQQHPSPGGAAEAAGPRIRRYVQWHLDKEFRTFSLLERPA